MGCNNIGEKKLEVTIKRNKAGDIVVKKIKQKGKNGKEYNLIYKEFISEKTFQYIKDFFMKQQ